MSAVATFPTMLDTVRRWILVLAVLCTGLSSGFFVTYSVSLTPGFLLLNDLQYVIAFQSLNIAIRNLSFAVIFFGSFVLLVVTALLYIRIHGISRWLVVSSLIFYAVLIAITVLVNVPLNQELAIAITDNVDNASAARSGFEHEWNLANHYRSAAAVGSFVCLILTLSLSSREAPLIPRDTM